MDHAEAISGSLTKYCTTDANCGTCIPFPTLRAVCSSLQHHQTFIDKMKLQNKQPKVAIFGESGSGTWMNGEVWHSSTAPHGVCDKTRSIVEQSEACCDRARAHNGIPQHQQAHLAAAIQIPIKSTTQATKGIFELLPRQYSKYIDEEWARKRYTKRDVNCLPKENETFKEWLRLNFFHLAVQYHMEVTFEEEVDLLFQQLEGHGVAVDHITVVDKKDDAVVFAEMEAKYPVLSEEQQGRFEKYNAEHHNQNEKVTWPCFVNGESKDTILIVLPTVIRDEDGRMLAVYIPDFVDRGTVKDFFQPLGNFYRDDTKLNEETTVGKTILAKKLDRRKVHHGSEMVNDAAQGMTMFGSRSCAMNRGIDGNTQANSLKLTKYAVHRDLDEGPWRGFDDRLRSALDPVAEHWRSIFPKNFLSTQYCHKDLPSQRRRGYPGSDATEEVPSLDSHHTIVNFGPTDSYPAPNHTDSDLGFTFAFAGKCYLRYHCRSCTFDEETGFIESVKWDFQ